MLTIWYPGWCAYPLNSSYPICSRGGSGSRKDGRQKERDNWRQNKVQTQIRLRGRGELGWKHSEEQSEINLDTPDGLKLVSAHVCVLLSSCQLVHLGLCVGIYLFVCFLFLQRYNNIWYVLNDQVLILAWWKKTKIHKNSLTNILLTFGWLDYDPVNREWSVCMSVFVWKTAFLVMCS